MTQVHYSLIGDRHQPVILFLHGFMGSGADFRQVVSVLSSDFCCLTLDLPGHGKTEVAKDLDYQMPIVAQTIVALLRELDIIQCFLVGYSMGGRLGLYLAVHFPQHFIKVVLEAASPGLKSQLERELRIKQDLTQINRLQTSAFSWFLEEWYSNSLFISFKQHPLYPQAIAQRLNNDPSKLVKSLQYMGLGVQPSLWKHLSTLQIPLLLIVGEWDSKFIAINQKMANLSPQAQLKVVKNSDHNVHFKHPAQVAQLIRSFCQ